MQPSSFFTQPVDSEQRLAYWFRNIAFVDWLMFSYLIGLNVAVWFIEPGPVRVKSAWLMAELLLVYLLIVGLLIRGELLKTPWLKALLYRFTHFTCIELSYFSFRDFLPAVNPRSLDQELLAFDLKWFGFEPALCFDQFVTSFSTEWFSFFYYSYFLLLLFHVGPILFFGKSGLRIAELGLGLTVITCIGHTVYMFVPGYGPFQAIPEQFQNQLPRGYWFDLIMGLVESGGAQKDIFPSLHTAIPLFLFLFNFRHRRVTPYNYSWPLVGFFAANIIISTMFLRWHYLIDVVAGIILAVSAYLISTGIGGWEQRNREQLGLGPTWPRWTDRPRKAE